jgi:hypothetical protein
VLTRATTVLGTLFLLGAFILTIMGRTGGGSVVSGVGGAPANQQTAPALPMPNLPAQDNGTTPAPANGTTGSDSTSTPATPAPQSSAPAGNTTPAPAGQ